jgi:succinate dehydrogenase / fumarate reductase membrane anchor subunit
MSIETKHRPTGRPDQPCNPLEQISWLFIRLSGLTLLALALFHLIYMHFVVPGGVSEIDYFAIANRWTNPASGFFWRFFDLLLLVLTLSHGAAGIRGAINRVFTSRNVRTITTGGLALSYLLLLASGTWLIFTFQG